MLISPNIYEILELFINKSIEYKVPIAKKLIDYPFYLNLLFMNSAGLQLSVDLRMIL